MSRKFTVIKKGDMRIGYTANPYQRKNPQLIVGIGNVEYQLASFSNEQKAEFFFDTLCDFLGVEKDATQAE